MKFNSRYFSLFTLALLLPLIPSATPKVNACAIVDATTQVAIRGSREASEQTNDLTIGHDNNCFNNNLLGTNTQLGITSGKVRQSNRSSYFVDGGNSNTNGIKTPVVTVTPQTQIDIYSPAHDPTFLQHLRQ